MAKRMGASGWVVVFAAAAALGLNACGKDDSPDPPTPGPDPGATAVGGEPDAGSPAATPEPGDVEPEGPPMIGGLQPAPGGACTPGATQPCLRDQLCMGVATCVASGSAFSACQCDSTPAIGGGIVGATCKTNSDCSGGGVCLRADGNDYAGAGGPAGGYCTFSCTPNPDGSDDCSMHDRESRCVGLGPAGATYCIRTCLSKDAEPGEAKCLNRPDLACVSVAADGVEGFSAERQSGYCAPRCGSDLECPFGRVCHRQGGICTTVASPGAPTGSSCTLDTNCDGKACEDRVDSVGVCTAECVLGALAGCGYSRDDPKRKAACITPLVAAGRFSEGPGDLGLCRELCDVDSDCLEAAKGIVCRPINDALATFTGRSGACVRLAN